MKSGGITSGALVVTANSSGDFFCRPARSRMELHPDKAIAHKAATRAAFIRLISNLMDPVPAAFRA